MNKIKPQSGRHSKRTTAKDMKLLLKQLHQDSKVFNNTPNRAHRNFPNFESNPIHYLSVAELTEWMKKRLKTLLTYQT